MFHLLSRYRYSQIKPCFKSLLIATKVSIRMSEVGLVCLQFMIQTESKQHCYVEYYVSFLAYDIYFSIWVLSHECSILQQVVESYDMTMSGKFSLLPCIWFAFFSTKVKPTYFFQIELVSSFELFSRLCSIRRNIFLINLIYFIPVYTKHWRRYMTEENQIIFNT